MKRTVLERNHCDQAVEVSIRFALWASRQERVVAKEIVEHFHCSIATAFRWKRAWLSANGLSHDKVS